MRYWWVNQNKTYKAEVGGGYMWSPKSNKDGGFNQFYKNMTEAGVGDIVFSFSNTLIKTVGVVSASARSSEKPKEFGKAGDAWDTDGWLVQVDYLHLQLLEYNQNYTTDQYCQITGSRPYFKYPSQYA